MEALEIRRRPVVLFDFDGTVADTGRAVMTSTRKTLAARGFSEAQMGDLRRMIGPPLWKSFHDFYGLTRCRLPVEELSRLLRLFPRGVACGGRRVPRFF